MKNGQCSSSRRATSPGFDLIWLGLGCSLTDTYSCLEAEVVKLRVSDSFKDVF